MDQLPSTAYGALKIMPVTKDQVVMFSKQLIQGVKNGEINPLELLVMLRALEKTAELVLESIDPEIQRAKDKYSEREFKVLGATLEKAEVGTKYAYNRTGDTEWERRHAAVESAKSLLSERESFLRALKEPITLVSEETGEITSIRPPLKSSKSSVKVFIK